MRYMSHQSDYLLLGIMIPVTPEKRVILTQMCDLLEHLSN